MCVFILCSSNGDMSSLWASSCEGTHASYSLGVADGTTHVSLCGHIESGHIVPFLV